MENEQIIKHLWECARGEIRFRIQAGADQSQRGARFHPASNINKHADCRLWPYHTTQPASSSTRWRLHPIFDLSRAVDFGIYPAVDPANTTLLAMEKIRADIGWQKDVLHG